MLRKHTAGPTVCLAVVAALVGGCRKESKPAATEMSSATPQQHTNQPTSVTGCLKAGEAEDTYVLTASQAAAREQTATYQLIGVSGVNLRDHIGKRVEVTGTVRTEQAVATTSTTQPAGKPAATSGTPTVSTQTELALKRLEVSQIRELGGRCEL